MPAIVESVEKDSIAQDLELTKGDEVISIDGVTPQDILEYRYQIMAETIDLHIKRVNGEEEIIEIEKDFDEDLGINFADAIFDKIMPCTNKCIFCFVDQQPQGLRDSLYIKDDDYRFSYFHGTYVTLTNLRQKDRERIEKMRLGPFYVSVHTTNPDLRVKMLRNPKAANIMQELKWLDSLSIPVHAQIVLCPGYNDAEELDRALSDLGSMDNVISIAIVPLGVTKFRKEPILQKVTPEIAQKTIEQVDNFNKKQKKNLAAASDEFFILAGENIKKASYYGEYAQIEDGVGTIRMLEDDFEKRKKSLPKKISKKSQINFVSGQLGACLMQKIVEELNKIDNLDAKLDVIKSEFWGEDITVTGLLTGQDLLAYYMSKKDEFSKIIIPSVMLKADSDEFLDGETVKSLSEKLNVKFYVIKDCYSTREIINIIKSL